MLGTIPSLRRDYVSETNRNRSKKELIATTLTIHNTANPKSYAKDEKAWLENPNNTRNASWHFCVDQNEALVAIPEDEVAWHAGTNAGNNSSLSIEVCESGDQTIVWKNAVGLTAWILVERDWGVEKLRKHQDWSGKYCPRLIIPRWDEFKSDVQETINHLKEQIAKQTILKKGKIKADILNARAGAGTTLPVVLKLSNGAAVNIYEEKNDWYRIGFSKWVSAKYVEIISTVTPVIPVPTPQPAQTKDWQTAGIEYLSENGLLSDGAGWAKKKNEAMPVWAVTILIANLHKSLKK